MTDSCDNPLTNAGRAERADRAIGHHNDEHSVIDLLADLRHWCDLHGQCYGDLDHMAHRHYLAELGEERGML